MYAIAPGDAWKHYPRLPWVRHKDKNGHAFKNIARRDAHNEFAHTRAAIGTHDNHVNVQTGNFGEQKIVYQHLAQYRSDRLHIVAMQGNLIGNIKPRDVVQPVRIDSHTETNSARCRNGMGSCKARSLTAAVPSNQNAFTLASKNSSRHNHSREA